MTRQRRIVTFSVALLLGILAGWWIIPLRQAHRAIAMIASEDADDRQNGWDWLLAPDDDSMQPRAARHMRRIETTLLTAPDAAILHGADALESIGRWSWDTRPGTLMLRELGARIGGTETDRRIAISRIEAAPARVDVETMLEFSRMLMQGAQPSTALEAFDAVAGWLGRGRIHRLMPAALPSDRAELHRRYWLAQAWSSTATHPLLNEDAIEMSSHLPAYEAQLFFVARRKPEQLPRERAAHDFAAHGELPLPYLLRQAGTDEAIALLRDRAGDGNAAARLALNAMDSAVELREAERVARDEDEPAWRRRLALWRWSPEGTSITMAILDHPPADPDDSCSLAALLAERHLTPDQAADRAQRWLRSFDDAEKRTGALLAVMIGAHANLLEQARAAAHGDLRPLLTVAAHAHSAVSTTRDDERSSVREMAHVALRARGEDIDPDIAVCLLATGDKDVLVHLTELPEAIDSAAMLQRAVQQRAVLIERFVPGWHEAIGRPLGGDMRGLHLHFDALRALRVVQRNALRWEPDRRVFSTWRTKTQ